MRKSGAAWLASLLLLLAAHSHATERILSFHSEIEVAVDGSMVVAETITVVTQGNKIRRGIYRDFPTRYRDRYGNDYRVDFKVLEVTRDGHPEPWHTGKLQTGVRVYAGKADSKLPPGTYTYNFRYRTARQIGFFSNHDELYWNATGNDWEFVIEQASAHISLPGDTIAPDLSLSAYTGPLGAKGTDYTHRLHDGGAYVASTRPLTPGEGLTFALGWPKGVVHAPGRWERIYYLLRDNLGLALASTALCGSALYLLLMWSRYGRDPEEGVIIPLYEPPQGYSPASARYISRMGYDTKAFTAAVINLAVKGYLRITFEAGDYTLTRLPATAKLAAGEAALLQKLFVDGTSLKLENKNHTEVAAARKAHSKALGRDYLNVYFKTNAKLMLPSAIGSLAAMGIIIATVSFVPWVLPLYAAIIILHILFAYLLKAPSARGRRAMDKLQGFKYFLEVAEKEDLARRNPPELTPELFEAYLPFAVALDVEEAWGLKFSQVLARLQGEAGRAYRPAWYQGSFNTARISTFTSSVGSNLSSAISSAGSPPGSSSGGGGGGSSGGGGGGGGGGGW